MPHIRLTVLGCGSSSGTPAIGCTCPVCTSTHPKNRRSRCSAWLDIGGQGWQIDTGPDFRSQALREQLPRIDGVLYTHPHADHLNGIVFGDRLGEALQRLGQALAQADEELEGRVSRGLVQL